MISTYQLYFDHRTKKVQKSTQDKFELLKFDGKFYTHIGEVRVNDYKIHDEVRELLSWEEDKSNR